MAINSRKIATTRGAFYRSRALIVLLLTLGLLYSTPPTFSCGPFIERAVFTYSKHPDFPLARFAAGGLGVLQPTYARSYLAVAYRHLAGAPLDAQEQQAATSLWAERLQTYWENDSENWVKSWLAARSKVAGVAAVTEIEVYRSVDKKDSYQTYLNCSEDGFRNAASTLDKMIEKHGAASPEVKEWVQAQDQVFQNCSGGASIPSPASLDAPAHVRAGRAYQIATANFYAGNFDAAEKIFGQIAADASSPWRQAAPYLLARALVRKATLAAEENKTDKATLAQAESQLKRVLADANLAAMHSAAERLLGFVRFRLSPEERLHELAQAIVKKNTGANFKQGLADYTLLLDKFMGDDEEKKFAELPKAGRADDVTDWVLTFQVSDKDALDYSLQKWQKTPSLPWLTASLSKITAADPRAAALVEAAAKVDPRSPAFASLAFHSVRLMIEANRTADARKRLDGLLGSSGSALPPSALNLFLSLRMKVATTLDDFLKYALRTPAGTTFDEDGRELSADTSTENKPSQSPRKRATFDTDATRVLNEKVPLSVLIESATNKTLPAHLRRDLAIAAWTRAVLLDDEAAAGSLVPILQALVPELKTNLEAYLAADGKDARRFSAVYIMLKFPGTRPVVDDGTGRETELEKIDDFRDNWWCAFEEPTGNASTGVETPGPSFLSEAERAAAARELKRLYAIGPAPNYFAAQAVKWADIKADDPRAPEALHLAVRATRYGCRDDKTGGFSKQAFDALHKRYPKSAWAQKTKYWFKD